MKLKIVISIIFLLALFTQQSAFATIYKCEVDGVTSYSEMQCQNESQSKGEYQPNSVSVNLAPIDSPEVYQVNNLLAQANTMDMDIANPINISNTLCNRDVYSGVINNMSRSSSYETKITVKFNYYKEDRESKVWDTQTKKIKLEPGESTRFSIQGRQAPSFYSIKCTVEQSVKPIESK
jgi:hypothetical protein